MLAWLRHLVGIIGIIAWLVIADLLGHLVFWAEDRRWRRLARWARRWEREWWRWPL